jgi:cytochrome c peroxidase
MRPVKRILVLAAVAACSKNSSGPASDERAAFTSFSPLPALPPDPSNPVADDPRAAALGQMLFFDPNLSGPLLVDSPLGEAGERGKVSCRTCHDGPALDDADAPTGHVSTGTKIGHRNTPPVLNSSFYRWSNWGGRFDSQWSLVLGAIENPAVMNGARLDAVRTVHTQYRAEYDALFAPLPEIIPETDQAFVDGVYANIGKAVAAYMRTLVARDAPFDRWVAGDTDAISPAAKRGAMLFLQSCASCHSGPHFSDDEFHVLGVAQFGDHVPAEDLGRFTDVVPLLASPFRTPGKVEGLAQTDDLRGRFRTPTLRNVAVTAPYMHAGQLATLEAVVAFYNNGGGKVPGVTKSDRMRRLDLSQGQQADLVEFMKALTDTAVPPERLADTSR